MDQLALVRGGVWRLPNGNTIISNLSSLFEIGPDSEIVWVHSGTFYPSRVIKYSFDYFNSNNLLYDINNDGLLNNSDLEMLILLVISADDSFTVADINSDSLTNIFDLLLLSDYLQTF